MKVTHKTLKALRIIRDHKIESCKQFAKFMWPDSDGWKTHVKVGKGVSKGGAMPIAAGGYLGKLKKWGLVNGVSHGVIFHLTKKGRECLNSFDNQFTEMER